MYGNVIIIKLSTLVAEYDKPVAALNAVLSLVPVLIPLMKACRSMYIAPIENQCLLCCNIPIRVCMFFQHVSGLNPIRRGVVFIWRLLAL